MLAVLTDEELVRRFQTGADPVVRNQCVNELLGRHQKRVALWCLRMTGNQDAAQDLAQEVFMRAYQHLDTFRSDAKFSTWLYSIARNQSVNFFRSRKQEPEEIEDAALFQVPDLKAASPYSEAERASERKAIEQLLAETLDETERRVFILHYVEEFPLHAVTRLLGLTNASGARAHMAAAKRKLERAAAVRKARDRGTKT